MSVGISVREHLRNILNGLEAQVNEILTGLAQMSEGIGFGKRVGDGTLVAVDRLRDVGTHGALLTKIEQVQRAIEKCREGTYGMCDVCKFEIPGWA